MRARGNTSSQASLVQCLCNSLSLLLACAATESFSLLPSLMPPPVPVISSSLDTQSPKALPSCEIPGHGSPTCRPVLRKTGKKNLSQSLSKENLSASCCLTPTWRDGRECSELLPCLKSPSPYQARGLMVC